MTTTYRYIVLLQSMGNLKIYHFGLIFQPETKHAKLFGRFLLLFYFAFLYKFQEKGKKKYFYFVVKLFVWFYFFLLTLYAKKPIKKGIFIFIFKGNSFLYFLFYYLPFIVSMSAFTFYILEDGGLIFF